MSDNEHKQEIRRMRTLLRKMAEMAEHAEQTGSFESGIRSFVKRYNAIVEHLEDNGAIPEELFPRLDEHSDPGQLGAESMLLGDYLDDLAGETSKESTKEAAKEAARGEKKPDMGMLIALAPFLEKAELNKLVHSHFPGQPAAPEPPKPPTPPGPPDLKAIADLAPFVDRVTLGQLVRTALAHHKLSDPNQLIALAPHMDKRELGQILQEYLPEWFGNPSPAAAEPEPAPAAAEVFPEPFSPFKEEELR